MSKNRVLILLALLSMVSQKSFSQDFNGLLVALDTVQTELKTALVDSFLQVHTVAPFTDDSVVFFVYKGSGSSPAVAGDFNSWNPSSDPMTKISGTNLWWRKKIFHKAARLDYKLVYNNGSNWILDPRNPFKAPGGFGDNSELRMPEYEAPDEIKLYFGPYAGTVRDTLFYSTNLGNSRRIKVYTPSEYGETDKQYPVVLVHDGTEYINFAKMPTILNNMISDNEIDPVLAVFVPPISSERAEEYQGSKQEGFTRFIIEEVMPWVDIRYRTEDNPEKRLVMGSSSGGNISLWLGMKHPEEFGVIGAFSPYIESDIREGFSGNISPNVRVYMNHGTYDHLAPIHESVNAFLPILSSKNYEYEYQEYPSSHSYGFWRGHIDDALKFAFPKQNSTNNEEIGDRAGEISLLQNYPNPFNPNTSIVFEVNSTSIITLDVYNSLGQKVKGLVDELKSKGRYSVPFNAGNLPSGVYFYRIKMQSLNNMSQFVLTKKMLLVK